MNILVTGGAGYIGSHTVIELLHAGHNIVILDNFSTSKPAVVDKIVRIARESSFPNQKVILERADILDRENLVGLLKRYSVEAVLHFAGLKSVHESIECPMTYYEVNVLGTLSLCQAMEMADVRKLIFSSSATVYGNPTQLPLQENDLLKKPANPYGSSKQMIEQILGDVSRSNGDWTIAILRYFNPIGAHHSGLLGEEPIGTPNNLVPFISRVAIGSIEAVNVFGNDFPTSDGTCIRDYIHVVDLAKGHVAALKWADCHNGVGVWNLGTGKGYSVLQVINTYQSVIGREIPYKFTDRRPGDIAACWADASKASAELGWSAERELFEMLADEWNFQMKNKYNSPAESA